MSSISERLAAIRERLETARSDNLEAVEREHLKESDGKRQSEEGVGRGIVDNVDLKSDASDTHTSWKRKSYRAREVGSADEADEEDGNARLRSMKRRARTSVESLASEIASEGKAANASVGISESPDVVVYGGKGIVNEEAVDRMVGELRQAEKRREKFKRRRAFYEDEGDITFINEGNRLFNRTLSKHYDKFDSVKDIKDNLERGTA